MVPWIVLALLVVHLGGLAETILAYEIVAMENRGAIAGRVVFVGPIPTLPDLVISKDQEVCGTAAPAQMLLVSAANRGVKHTVAPLARPHRIFAECGLASHVRLVL